jgi:hypothetical protein
MSRYVYVVTRTVRGSNPHATPTPNLGVTSSGRKALQHYHLIIDDRLGLGGVLAWKRSEKPKKSKAVEAVYRAYITYPPKLKNAFGDSEELIVERWPI